MAGSLRSGWRALARSPGTIGIATLVLSTTGVLVHVVAQYLLGRLVAGSSPCERVFLDQVLTARCGPTNERAQLTLLLALFLLYVIGQLVVTGLYRAALDTVDAEDAGHAGDAVPARGPFRGWLSGTVLVSAVLAAALLTINTVFLVLPAVALGFLIRYAPLFVLDQGLGPVRALVASTRFVVADLAGELWFTLKAVLALLAGLLLLGLGLYVAVPVVLLAQTQRYRGRVPATLSADRGC